MGLYLLEVPVYLINVTVHPLFAPLLLLYHSCNTRFLSMRLADVNSQLQSPTTSRLHNKYFEVLRNASAVYTGLEDICERLKDRCLAFITLGFQRKANYLPSCRLDSLYLSKRPAPCARSSTP